MNKEMGESEEQAHLDVQGLSLIDVSSENDCLISPPQTHPPSERGCDRKSVKFTEASYMEAMAGSSEDMEQGQHSPNSWGQEKKSKGGKYNLRKSLAWDSAFFTSAGFLDPEELSTMIGGEKCSLPRIQEDINKSCDSLTTLDSETLTLESLEAELFEDIRASIQKTSKASSFSEKDSGVKESKSLLLNKVRDAPQEEIKVKVAAKKPNGSTQESLRTLNRVSVHHQASQPVSRIKNLPKATRGTRQITPVSVTSTKRISSGFKNAEMEKNAKTATVRGTTMLKSRALGVPKNVLRRPAPPTKTLLPSISSSRKELTSSCSSSESAGTAFSDKNHKSSLELVNGGNHSSRSTSSSSSNTFRSPKIASRSNHLTESLELANYLKSATVNLCSNVSPASSISEWSSASSSATLTVDQRSSSAARASLGARASNTLSKDKESLHGLDSHHQSASNNSDVNSSLPACSSKGGMKAISVTGSGPCTTIPGKPSGLRMPSPKIGFFDGGRSSSRTPKGSVLSRPAVPNGLPKSRVGAVSLKESPDQGKLLKAKPADTLASLNNGRAGKQTSAGIKLKTLPEEPPIGGRKISSASSNTKNISLVSPKVEIKSSLKSSAGSCSNVEQVGNEGSVLDTNSSDSSFVLEKNEIGSPGLQKHVQSTGSPDFRSTKVSLLKGVNEEMSDSSSKCEIKSFERTAADERCGFYISSSQLQSYSDSDGKKLPIEGQVARLAKMFGAVDLNKGALDESSDAPKACEVSVDKPIFPVTSKDVATTRVPLSPKDSACNAYETLDVLIPENLLQEDEFS